jgi:hypothetical protein
MLAISKESINSLLLLVSPLIIWWVILIELDYTGVKPIKGEVNELTNKQTNIMV